MSNVSPWAANLTQPSPSEQQTFRNRTGCHTPLQTSPPHPQSKVAPPNFSHPENAAPLAPVSPPSRTAARIGVRNARVLRRRIDRRVLGRTDHAGEGSRR